MKPFAYLLTFLLAIQNLVAQTIPNPDFAVWITDSIGSKIYLEPQGWNSTNAVTNNYGPFSKSGIVIDSDGYNGNFAVEISTVSIGQTGTAQPYAGILTNGTFIDTFTAIIGGTPFNYLPDSVYFYYQYSSSVGGNGLMVAFFLKNNNGTRDTIGFAFDTINIAPNFAQAALPVFRTDSGTAQPDSVLMIFISCINPANPLNGQLIVDDISFGGPYTGIQNVSSNFMFDVIPNPADDHFIIQTPMDAPAVNSVAVYSMDGKTMKYAGDTGPVRRLNIDIGELQPGNYIIQVKLADGSSAQRMIMIAR